MADLEIKEEQTTRFVVHDEVEKSNLPVVLNQQNAGVDSAHNNNGTAPEQETSTNKSSLEAPDILQKFCKSSKLVMLAATILSITVFAVGIWANSPFSSVPKDILECLTILICFYFAVLASATQNRLNQMFGKHTLDLKIDAGIPAISNKLTNLIFAVNPIAWLFLLWHFGHLIYEFTNGYWLLKLVYVLLCFSTSVLAIGQSIAYFSWQFAYPAKLHIALQKLSNSKYGSVLDKFRALIFIAIFWMSCVVAPILSLMPGAQNQTFYLVCAIVLQSGIFVVANKMIDKAKYKKADNNEILSPALLDSETEIGYKPMANTERWLKQRFSQTSGWKAIVLASMVAIILMFNPQDSIPQLLAELLKSNGPNTGDLPNQATADGLLSYNLNYVFVLLFGGTFTASLMALGYWLLRLPKSLATGPDGLRFIYHKVTRKADRVLKWRDLQSIKIQSAAGSNTTLKNTIVFKTKKKNIKLKLDNFKTPDDREKLLHQIEMYAPNIPRDAEVMELLAKPADHSYTEIWLAALSAPPKRERLKPLAPGAIMHSGEYTVVNELGSGGQGFAYLARDGRDKEVVLKEFVLPIYVDIQARRRALERFENEAKLLSRLDHPQVVKLVSFFIEDHRAYLVLEHIDGQNLRQLVAKNGPLSQEQVKVLHTKMQKILDYLHGLSPPLVHRDFTPDNLILDKNGNLKLIDFNVAQEMQDGTTGTVVGKQSYLPPEQFRGQAEPASDLYAMGATLYYLLTGKDPVPISTIHISKETPDIDPELDKLMTRLTNLAPEFRH